MILMDFAIKFCVVFLHRVCLMNQKRKSILYSIDWKMSNLILTGLKMCTAAKECVSIKLLSLCHTQSHQLYYFILKVNL